MRGSLHTSLERSRALFDRSTGRAAILALLLVSACVGEVVEPDRDDQTDVDPSTASVSTRDGGTTDAGQDDGTSEDDRTDTGMDSPALDAGDTAQAPDPCGPDSESLVETLRVKDLAFYQTVKVTVVSGGSWVGSPVAPVVQGKDAFVRMFVEPLSGYAPHGVLGVLTLRNGSEVTRLEARLTPRAASLDSDLTSSFNFTVPASALTADTTLSASIVEEKCNPERKDNPSARFPKTGSQALKPAGIGTLRVVLVPVRIGSLLADTSAAQLEGVRSALLAHYPVPNVDVSVAPVLTWTNPVNADGSGWSELLNEIRKQRVRDAADKDVYYFGLVSPKSTLRSYCLASCVLGLAPQTTFVSSVDQVGLGVGFFDDNTYSTVVHELGHAHGRGHAPCAPNGGKIDGVDGKYPYTGGDIGSWGWDARSKALVAPTLKDMMGYCDPTWISDYTYNALAIRSQAINKSGVAAQKSRAALTLSEPSEPWHSLILYADGRARWAGLITHEAPNGEREPLRVLNAQGQLIAELEAARVRLDHTSESFLYIPEPQADWATLEVGGFQIPLTSVLPEL
jgi:hypothetical protein